MVMKKLLSLLLLTVLLAGCTTVTHYESRNDPGPARAKDYPIYLYPKEVRVPRPYEVVGVMEIRDTPLTMFGGSFESEVAELRKRARKVGADAVQLTSVEQPDFLHAKHRMDANLIRFTDQWENLTLTEEQFITYLREQREKLDPIEGVWQANDLVRSRVGIIRNDVRPGRDFVAFILDTQNPTWQRGDKKLDLTRGERPGVYRGAFYLDDFRRKGVAFSLMGPRTNVFVLPMSDADQPVVFAKE
jgi:hypothetical protein